MPAPLQDLVWYTSHDLDRSEVDSDRGQALLNEVRKYDPNASFNNYATGGESGGTTTRLDFDASKLPAGFRSGRDVQQVSGQGYNDRDFNLVNDSKLWNPNAVQHSDIYGDTTSNLNVKNPTKDWLDYTGMAAMAVGGMVAGGAASSLIGSAMAGGAGAGAGAAAGAGTGAATGAAEAAAATPWWVSPAVNTGMQLATSGGKIDPYSLAATWATGGLTGAGVDPGLAKLAGQGIKGVGAYEKFQDSQEAAQRQRDAYVTALRNRNTYGPYSGFQGFNPGPGQ